MNRSSERAPDGAGTVKHRKYSLVEFEGGTDRPSFHKSEAQAAKVPFISPANDWAPNGSKRNVVLAQQENDDERVASCF